MSTFSDFMNEGGYGMWPIAALGAVTLGAAIHFAWRPERRRIGLVLGLAATTLVQAVHATWSDLAAVFHTLEDPERVPDAELTRTLYAGLKECTRPGLLAGLFLVLVLLSLSVGAHRAAGRVVND